MDSWRWVGDSPRAFRLDGNIPNPFIPKTTISFDLPKGQAVSLRVHDTTVVGFSGVGNNMKKIRKDFETDGFGKALVTRRSSKTVMENRTSHINRKKCHEFHKLIIRNDDSPGAVRRHWISRLFG